MALRRRQAMWVNVGNIDRVIRVIVGIVLLGYGIFGGASGSVTWIFDVLGIILIATGALRICLIYKLLGISTAPKR